MSKFIGITIKQKNFPPQAYEPRTISVSQDAILLTKPWQQNLVEVILKPEYELRVKEAVGIPHNGTIEYITATQTEFKKLFE